MNPSLWIVLFMLPIIVSYPHEQSNSFNRFLNNYLRQRDGNHGDKSPEEQASRRQPFFRLIPLNYHHGYFQQQQQQQHQPNCLPAIWTCGPSLPPCCVGLMCYDGNAKRGRHCVARG